MTDTRKAALEPVSWLYVDPYWNARQGLLDAQGKKVVGAVVGRVHPAANKEKGNYWWVAAPWCGGHRGEESGYAQTLDEAKKAIEAVAEKSPIYRVRTEAVA